MNANAAPPPGTRPPVDVASFDRSQLSVYLKDVVTLALENRPEDPIAFASDYLRRVLGGAGAVARAHQYLSLSPHTRRAFTDNALLAFEVLSGDEEERSPCPAASSTNSSTPCWRTRHPQSPSAFATCFGRPTTRRCGGGSFSAPPRRASR